MSVLVPKMHKQFVSRAPKALRAWKVKVPKLLDPVLHIVEAKVPEAKKITAELDSATLDLYFNASAFHPNPTKLNRRELLKLADEHSDTLWHEFVHYLQFATTLGKELTVLDVVVYKIRKIFQSQEDIYYGRALEQHAYIEQIRYLIEVKKYKPDQVLEVLLVRYFAGMLQKFGFTAAETKTFARAIITKNRNLYVKNFFEVRFRSKPPHKLFYPLYWAIATKGYYNVQKIFKHYEKFLRNLDYHIRTQPKQLGWNKPLSLAAELHLVSQVIANLER